MLRFAAFESSATRRHSPNARVVCRWPGRRGGCACSTTHPRQPPGASEREPSSCPSGSCRRLRARRCRGPAGRGAGRPEPPLPRLRDPSRTSSCRSQTAFSSSARARAATSRSPAGPTCASGCTSRAWRPRWRSADSSSSRACGSTPNALRRRRAASSSESRQRLMSSGPEGGRPLLLVECKRPGSGDRGKRPGSGDRGACSGRNAGAKPPAARSSSARRTEEASDGGSLATGQSQRAGGPNGDASLLSAQERAKTFCASIRRRENRRSGSELTSRAIVARWSHRAWDVRKRDFGTSAVPGLADVYDRFAGRIHDVISAPDRIRTCDLRFRSLTSVL
jgi:hypothetical protein